jgi:hypothetical protein
MLTFFGSNLRLATWQASSSVISRAFTVPCCVLLKRRCGLVGDWSCRLCSVSCSYNVLHPLYQSPSLWRSRAHRPAIILLIAQDWLLNVVQIVITIPVIALNMVGVDALSKVRCEHSPHSSHFTSGLCDLLLRHHLAVLCHVHLGTR